MNVTPASLSRAAAASTPGIASSSGTARSTEMTSGDDASDVGPGRSFVASLHETAAMPLATRPDASTLNVMSRCAFTLCLLSHRASMAFDRGLPETADARDAAEICFDPARRVVAESGRSAARGPIVGSLLRAPDGGLDTRPDRFRGQYRRYALADSLRMVAGVAERARVMSHHPVARTLRSHAGITCGAVGMRPHSRESAVDAALDHVAKRVRVGAILTDHAFDRARRSAIHRTRQARAIGRRRVGVVRGRGLAASDGDEGKEKARNAGQRVATAGVAMHTPRVERVGARVDSKFLSAAPTAKRRAVTFIRTFQTLLNPFRSSRTPRGHLALSGGAFQASASLHPCPALLCATTGARPGNGSFIPVLDSCVLMLMVGGAPSGDLPGA